MAMARINLIGQRFGRLTVIEPSTKRTSSGEMYWRTVCDCGNIKEAESKRLRSGVTKSCGCWMRQASLVNFEIRHQKRRDQVDCIKGHPLNALRVCPICRGDAKRRYKMKNALKRDENLIQVLNERLEYLNEVIDNVEKVRG